MGMTRVGTVKISEDIIIDQPISFYSESVHSDFISIMNHPCNYDNDIFYNVSAYVTVSFIMKLPS